jgi:hypothetical protein
MIFEDDNEFVPDYGKIHEAIRERRKQGVPVKWLAAQYHMTYAEVTAIIKEGESGSNDSDA